MLNLSGWARYSAMFSQFRARRDRSSSSARSLSSTQLTKGTRSNKARVGRRHNGASGSQLCLHPDCKLTDFGAGLGIPTAIEYMAAGREGMLGHGLLNLAEGLRARGHPIEDGGVRGARGLGQLQSVVDAEHVHRGRLGGNEHQVRPRDGRLLGVGDHARRIDQQPPGALVKGIPHNSAVK